MTTTNPEMRRRVLVVDDDVDVARSLAMLVELWGHDVDVVHVPAEVVAAVRRYRPEVVLMDIALPGTDGYQLARRLRQEEDLGAVVLIAMTGHDLEEDRERSREAGFDHHLVKPVAPDLLQDLLRRCA